jgi:molecular chaperone GrpE
VTPDQLSSAEKPIGDAAAEPEPEAAPPPARDQQLEDQLRRALADLDNLRKRYDRELALERARERARVTAEWLPVVDNLERALQHADAEGGAVLEGVRAVYDQALGVLARLGYPRFDDVGERFDTKRHEAVTAIADDSAPGTVVATVRPGYGTTEALLRPAGVVVSRGSD